uniref:Cyclic nucleotide-binding domain-containing protein n=1 Tax=Phytophthora ramorum TaxID=164328 RepID=H3GQS5_PHYRM
MSVFCHWSAFYWAFTTLTTVGYGDVKPSIHSPYELVVVIILIVVNATVFGYILSSVMTLIQNLDPSDREYRLLMTEMKDYLRDSSVSERLCKNVKMHYQHYIACTNLFPEQKLFDKMAPSLRFDVARLVAVETLFAIPLITVMEDAFKGFVSYALFLLKPVCIQRGETVCRCGSPGIETFFLVEGECDLLNSKTGVGRIIGENSVFEQYALMADPEEHYRTISTATAISSKCILYSLTIHDFKKLENVSPAVSTYFLSQLASVLVADDMYSLLPNQKCNVQLALRRGQNYRSVAEQTHGRVKLKDLGKVAMANLYKRRGSEWSPDLLPKQLQILAEKEQACGVTVVNANVNAIANRQFDHDSVSTQNQTLDSNSMREQSATTIPTPSPLDPSGGIGANFYSTNQSISEVSENSQPSRNFALQFPKIAVMSLSRRFLSLPQELEGTSLPPQVSGKRCGTVVLCVGHILESAVSSRPLPSVSLVRVRWWGEQQPSSLFRPSLLSAAPVAVEEPRTIAMKYPVRVPPDQLVAYFSDMKDLTLDVIDRGSKKKFGELS